MSNSRLAFEQAIENEHPDDYSFDFDPNGHYRDEILERHFWAWQASRQALNGEATGTLTVDHHKNDPTMQNVDYEHADGVLEPGVYKLYTHPTSADAEFDIQKECWRHEAEDLQALHRNLDDAGAPQYENGTELSAWGRVLRMNQNSASADVPDEWKLVPRLSTESMELAARDWGIPNITPDEAGEVWDAMVEAIPEPPKITDAVASVPKGWTIEPFDDGFGVEGISVLWPGNRGGAHLRANDPKNSIAQNLLYDLAEALIYGSRPDDRPALGQRKAAQIGETIGVLAQNQDGKVAAVTDLGRCTWLSQDVTGAGDGESVPNSEYVRALQDACDIIQADANTEENYGSLCRIGNVLAKLNGKREQNNDS